MLVCVVWVMRVGGRRSGNDCTGRRDGVVATEHAGLAPVRIKRRTFSSNPPVVLVYGPVDAISVCKDQEAENWH